MLSKEPQNRLPSVPAIDERYAHFISFDDRFCGIKKTHRFVMNDDEVTCPKCRANYAKDRMYLTPQGQKYVDELRAAEAKEAE